MSANTLVSFRSSRLARPIVVVFGLELKFVDDAPLARDAPYQAQEPPQVVRAVHDTFNPQDTVLGPDHNPLAEDEGVLIERALDLRLQRGIRESLGRDDDFGRFHLSPRLLGEDELRLPRD